MRILSIISAVPRVMQAGEDITDYTDKSKLHIFGVVTDLDDSVQNPALVFDYDFVTRAKEKKGGLVTELNKNWAYVEAVSFPIDEKAFDAMQAYTNALYKADRAGALPFYYSRFCKAESNQMHTGKHPMDCISFLALVMEASGLNLRSFIPGTKYPDQLRNHEDLQKALSRLKKREGSCSFFADIKTAQSFMPAQPVTTLSEQQQAAASTAIIKVPVHYINFTATRSITKAEGSSIIVSPLETVPNNYKGLKTNLKLRRDHFESGDPLLTRAYDLPSYLREALTQSMITRVASALTPAQMSPAH